MSSDRERQLEEELSRVTAALESERRNAEQWRTVAEERRVALERIRQHPVVRLLLAVASRVLPPLRRALRRAESTGRRARRAAAGLQTLPARLTAAPREQRLRASVAALPSAPTIARRVAIVILTRDGHDNLNRLLPALRATTVGVEDLEVLVVDNGSGADTVAFLGAQPDVRVLRNDANLSFAAANDAAVAATDAEVVVFCNDDLEPLADGWLQRLVAALEVDGVVAAGAHLVYPRRSLLGPATRDLGTQHRGITFRPTPGGVPRAVNVGEGDDPDIAPGVDEVAAATAACLAVARDAYDAVGGLDDGYVYGAEDVDLCWRLRQAGGRIVVVRDAVLFHHEGATRHREDPAALHRRQQRNWDRFAELHGPALTRAVTRDRLRGGRLLSDVPFSLGITITRDLPEAGYGDWFTAHELGTALEQLGWRITYLERYRDAWYELPDHLDAVLVLLDTFDLRRVARQGLTTIAWIRNWTERWTGHPWFDDYDLVLASSATSAELVRGGSRHDPVVMPLATNAQRFRRQHGQRAGAVFTGNYWGRDARLPEVVAAVPALDVYGKGWEEVPAVADAWRGPLPYDELPALYGHRLVVVDQAADHTRPYGSLNSRVFDALACGALPVTNQRAGARELFGDRLPTWDTPDDLGQLVNELLADPEGTARRAAALADEVHEHHTYAARAGQLRDLLLERADRPSFALATSVPDASARASWGDWHLAEALGRELRASGHDARVLTKDQWAQRDHRSVDVFVHLKGRSVAPRAEGQTHVVWNISHPEELTPAEADAADLVLVGSSAFADDLRTRTDTSVEVLLQATDEWRFRRLPRDPAYAHDLAFVGNSKFTYRPVVRDALAVGLRPAIYGANWEKYLDPELVVASHVPNADLPRLYSSVKVLLNDHWEGMRRWGYVSNRLFDALACGAVVVSDHVEGLEALFDGAVVTYRDPDELREVVTRLLADPDERQERAARGQRAVLERHTFRHRTAELLAAVAAVRQPDGAAVARS